MHGASISYYFCYDNEAFANTGFQLSPASPFGSQTGTTPVTPATRGGTALHKQDLFKLWHAQAPAFLATVSPAYPLDLMDKVARAGRATGPKMFISLASCPPGWGVEPSDAVEVAKLAVETGVWPLKEVQDGQVVHTVRPPHFRPVEDYLQGQARYRHLFDPVRQEDILSQLQTEVDHYWAEADVVTDDTARAPSDSADRRRCTASGHPNRPRMDARSPARGGMGGATRCAGLLGITHRPEVVSQLREVPCIPPSHISQHGPRPIDIGTPSATACNLRARLPCARHRSDAGRRFHPRGVGHPRLG